MHRFLRESYCHYKYNSFLLIESVHIIDIDYFRSLLLLWLLSSFLFLFLLVLLLTSWFLLLFSFFYIFFSISIKYYIFIILFISFYLLLRYICASLFFSWRMIFKSLFFSFFNNFVFENSIFSYYILSIIFSFFHFLFLDQHVISSLM